MIFHGNDTRATTTAASSGQGPATLLWLPYVGLALLCLGFLAANFWLYHRKHRQRYRRKAEVLETRERVLERRLLLNLIKARHVITRQQHETAADDSSVCATTVLTQISLGRNSNASDTAHL